MPEVDYIAIRPDKIGWTLIVCVTYDNGGQAFHEYALGDAIQFHAEVERTIGKWLADGPADFHNAPDPDYDLARDIERGK